MRRESRLQRHFAAPTSLSQKTTFDLEDLTSLRAILLRLLLAVSFDLRASTRLDFPGAVAPGTSLRFCRFNMI